jgi:DNA-binding Lrp family transcriptional regulator
LLILKGTIFENYRVYGSYDIIARVAFGMAEKLQELLKIDLKRLDDIVSTVTLLTRDLIYGALL